jgi:hypothetical protein
LTELTDIQYRRVIDAISGMFDSQISQEAQDSEGICRNTSLLNLKDRYEVKVKNLELEVSNLRDLNIKLEQDLQEANKQSRFKWIILKLSDEISYELYVEECNAGENIRRMLEQKYDIREDQETVYWSCRVLQSHKQYASSKKLD